MKVFSFILLIFIFYWTINTQFLPIGTIDYYGLRTVSEKQIRETLQIKEGDEALKTNAEKTEIEKRL